MEKKRVLIDGFNLGLEAGTGVATYARNLTFCARDLGYHVDVLYNVRAAPGSNKLMREIAFFDANVGKPLKLLEWIRYSMEAARIGSGVTAREVPITGQVIADTFKSRLPYFDKIWNYPDVFGRAERHFYMTSFLYAMRMPVRLQHHAVDLAHWTYPLPVYMPGARNIYTLHDLVPLRLPYTTLDNKRRYFNLVRVLGQRADHIVTVSETSKRDIVNLLGVKEENVTNTYQAVEIPQKYAGKPDDVVKREVEGTFNVGYKEYMLFFGAIEPKKNVGRLIEGYLGSKIETPLLLVGKMAWKSEQETRLLNDDATSYLEQVGSLTFRRRKIFHVDYAPFPLLVSLIRGAKAVLFPSLYEGFGLPVLEAMKLGTPVLTASSGALKEVAADGALLVDPYDTRSIAEGIAALDANPALRADLSERGKKRADLFSAEAYQKRIEELYARVMAPNAMKALSVMRPG
ncbi:MAG TPA: glycosyltransferase family 1 protein [Lacipirellulaceae bacterium]|nr:glycosyltransferase family 1 protein [Lacipirellulaceae bacterium]